MISKLSKPLVLFLLIPVLLAGCSQSLTRVRIQRVGEFEKAFVHDGAPVILWTDLDVEYVDSTILWYEIEFLKDGEHVAETTCNLFDTGERLMARNAVVGGVTKQSYLAPLNCAVSLPAGEITIQGSFLAKGGDVHIFRADLVVNEKEQP
jgi:hypothetical protein